MIFPKGPSSGCHNKLPYTGWLKHQTLISHISGDWEVPIQGAGRLFLVRTPAVPSRSMAVFLCPHMMGRGERRKLPSAFPCMRAQSCPISCDDPMDCSPPGSSVHGILQARVLEWAAISCSRGSSRPGIEPASAASPALAGGFFGTEPPEKPLQTRGSANARSPRRGVKRAWLLTTSPLGLATRFLTADCSLH